MSREKAYPLSPTAADRPLPPMSAYELELFAGHCGEIMREPARVDGIGGRFGMTCRHGLPCVYIMIEPSSLSATDGPVWDSCTMSAHWTGGPFGGHWVGNRFGAIKAYARYVAGDAEWWRAE